MVMADLIKLFGEGQCQKRIVNGVKEKCTINVYTVY